MLRKGLFILAHQIGDTSFHSTYRRVLKEQWLPREEQNSNQERNLRQLIEFAYTNVPYYHNLFRSLNLSPDSIRTLEDLQKLPVLTKDVIKVHWDELKPANLTTIKYQTRATGGSSGTPMEYRISSRDRFLGGALLYRGWGYAGYELGDRMVFLAGSSLDMGTKSTLVRKMNEAARNIRKLSSFDMEEEHMKRFAQLLRSFHPKYIRGYPSSIAFFARWLEGSKTTVPSLKAIFTTSEKLYPKMRSTIEEVFHCDVFDNYGLNDGGISAYECPQHQGLHIDTERSIMEVVDGDYQQVTSGQGELLATSLFNYAMPLIRYSSGDEGYITDDRCGCGRDSLLLREVIGRTTDMLVTPEGKNVHGWFFLFIFWEYGKGIREYQVVQQTPEKILIRIVPEDDFQEKVLDDIRQVVSERSSGWVLDFKFVDKINRTAGGKLKYIINEVPEI